MSYAVFISFFAFNAGLISVLKYVSNLPPLDLVISSVIQVTEFHSEEDEIYKVFTSNFLSLWKIFLIEGYQNVINKSGSLHWIFMLYEKLFFWSQKLSLKTENGQWSYKISKCYKKSFKEVYLDAKINRLITIFRYLLISQSSNWAPLSHLFGQQDKTFNVRTFN